MRLNFRAAVVAALALLVQGCTIVTSGNSRREPVFEVRPSVSQADCAAYVARGGRLVSDVVDTWQINVTVSPVDDHCLHGASFRVLRRPGGGRPQVAEARVDTDQLFAEDRRRYTLVAFIDAGVVNVGDDIIVECNSNGDWTYVVFRLDCADRFDIVKIVGRRHYRLRDGYWFRFNPGPPLVDTDELLDLLASASDSTP